MEELLHYVWRHKIFPLHELYTTGGQPIEIIDVGLPNSNAGPDFFNAKLKIADTLWVGNVEIHIQASEWLRHGHDNNKAYDNVVLHVVSEANCDVYRTNGELIPQLVLPIPDVIRQRYFELREAEIYPRCYSILRTLPQLKIHAWLSALQAERLKQKATLIAERLKRFNNHWEDVFFITLSRNFGFGLNGDAFETWASRLPFRAVDKHRDNLFQVEALFFGQAGLLEEDSLVSDDYYRKLKEEYRYLCHKFQLTPPLPGEQWCFMRLRPGNFPHVRLAQLAHLYHKEHSLFSRVMEAETIDEVKRILTTKTSSYWEEHFNFKKIAPKQEKQVGVNALNLIVINTVVPFLYAYGRYMGQELLCHRAATFLESLRAENNYITRLWEGAGLPVFTAADSQAIIQLQKNYCEKRNCLRCRFGYEYLKQK